MGPEDILSQLSFMSAESLQSALERNPSAANMCDQNGESVLWHALFDLNDMQKADLILRYGADIEVGKEGATNLHWACTHWHLDHVRYLLRNAADPNAQNQDGMRPLHLIVCGGPYLDPAETLAIARALLENKASIDAPNSSGLTPLHLAARHAYTLEMVQLLLDYGANPNCIAKENELHPALTPLHMAVLGVEEWAVDVVSEVQERIVDLLLSRGAKTDSHDGLVMPPIVYAVGMGLLGITKQLWSAMRKQNLEFASVLLIIAASRGRENVSRFLLEQGADPRWVNSKGSTAIQVAIDNGHADLARVLESSPYT